jgi:heme oxygenase (biliverdin-IX-beta and delta-forming)
VQPSSFLQKLRGATTTAHQALEENPTAKVLMSPTVTLDAVDQYLKSMYGFVKGFEEIVFPILENSLPQLSERRKTRLFAVDLQISVHEINELPLFPSTELLAQYNSLSKAWGGMYVLEGSTLGGQIITKHLQGMLGEASAKKLNYLRPYGSQASLMWKNFLHYFSLAAVSPCEEDEIIDSAVQTFSLLDNWMTSTNAKILQHHDSRSNK